MQRVKVGMIGLAAVMLLIGVAGIVFNAASREPPVVAAGASKPDVVANLAVANGTARADVANEPLAELGVAPGAAADNSQAQAPARH